MFHSPIHATCATARYIPHVSQPDTWARALSQNSNPQGTLTRAHEGDYFRFLQMLQGSIFDQPAQAELFASS